MPVMKSLRLHVPGNKYKTKASSISHVEYKWHDRGQGHFALWNWSAWHSIQFFLVSF